MYSNLRGRKTDLTETLSYQLAAVTSLAHLSVAWWSVGDSKEFTCGDFGRNVLWCVSCVWKVEVTVMTFFLKNKLDQVNLAVSVCWQYLLRWCGICSILFAVLRYSEPPMPPSTKIVSFNAINWKQKNQKRIVIRFQNSTLKRKTKIKFEFPSPTQLKIGWH